MTQRSLDRWLRSDQRVIDLSSHSSAGAMVRRTSSSPRSSKGLNSTNGHFVLPATSLLVAIANERHPLLAQGQLDITVAMVSSSGILYLVLLFEDKAEFHRLRMMNLSTEECCR